VHKKASTLLLLLSDDQSDQVAVMVPRVAGLHGEGPEASDAVKTSKLRQGRRANAQQPCLPGFDAGKLGYHILLKL
jgi:hypothetical protein